MVNNSSKNSQNYAHSTRENTLTLIALTHHRKPPVIAVLDHQTTSPRAELFPRNIHRILEAYIESIFAC